MWGKGSTGSEGLDREGRCFVETLLDGVVGVGEPAGHRGVEHSDDHLTQERGGVIAADGALSLAVFDQADGGLEAPLGMKNAVDEDGHPVSNDMVPDMIRRLHVKEDEEGWVDSG